MPNEGLCNKTLPTKAKKKKKKMKRLRCYLDVQWLVT